MNGISNALNGLYDTSGFQVHSQVLITSWVILAILLGSIVIAVRNPQTIQTVGQNFFEYIGEEYSPWVPFIGTMFLFIFVSNWSDALLTWKIIQLHHEELAAPKNDINTTVALALLTSVAYFYAVFRLFGKILAVELVVVVLVSLVPSVVPIPVMFLRLFTSGIQALIFATLAAAYISESIEGHH
ncbi:hypothetical protein V6Z11_D10G255000 [Gossypium hirsutum]